ncbi:Arc family DNA-binding protein [Nocardiopsis sp. CNT312]|uniref:Arc family DNA-binding protein n=1 Tax=Nocardiopsis sp. CNT312 TaxID=1137268 RepID=UPI0018CC5B56
MEPCRISSGAREDEKRISLRLPAELHARLAERARRDRRPLNAEIVHLLETTLGDAGSPEGEPAWPVPPCGRADSSPPRRPGLPSGRSDDRIQ